jgi:hypothetical protein
VANNQKQGRTIQESRGHGKSGKCRMVDAIFLTVVPDGDYILHNQTLLDHSERLP